MTTLHKAPSTITKTTMHLEAGDVISTGNCFHGFWSYTIVDVTPSAHNKRTALVTMRFDHGGEVRTVHGKNARWSVITKEAK